MNWAKNRLPVPSRLFVFIYIALVGVLPAKVIAQIRKDPTRWSISSPAKPAKIGNVIDVTVQASIDANWHIYSTDLNPDIGPLPTTIKAKPNASYAVVGKPIPVGVSEVFEEVWNAKIRQFDNKATFIVKVKVLKPNPTVTLTVEYMACSAVDGTCLPPAETELQTTVRAIAATTGPAAATAASTGIRPVSTSAVAATTNVPGTDVPSMDVPASASGAVTQADTATGTLADTATAAVQAYAGPAEPGVDPLAQAQSEQADSQSLWGFALAAFLSGLLALLTPCVFPIIPMTVSFFTNQQGGWWKALLYGVSIILIYVLVGTVVSRLNGPAFANFLSTHWIPNMLFFAVFFVFGLSFLGLFEITLPSSVVNRADAASERGGLAGIFFMAFTLVLVSFSCTGPIVGSLLVASAGGAVIKPIVGMAAFASAFAIPFTLFALFPQWLQKLPKSGGWLNSVKVVLGFLELALSLKFLSIADQVYHWNLLDREVYLSFWIVIFSLIGLYLLGKIKLPHDSPDMMVVDNAATGSMRIPVANVPVSIPRLLLAIFTFTFVVYMVPGLWGAPLKALAGYLPPETTQDFNLNRRGSVGSGTSVAARTVRHGDLFKLPHGIDGFFDYKEALAYSKTVNKPVFIDFTGHGCVNCREMEQRVWSDPAVLSRLNNGYVVVALYVDDKTELPESEWYTSTYDKKVKKTIGAQNADLQITRYNNNAQPHYCLVDATGKLLVAPTNYNLDVTKFTAFLDSGKVAFTK